MDEPPLPIPILEDKPFEDKTEVIKIEQNEKTYELILNIIKGSITFKIKEEEIFPTIYYTNKMTLNDIKDMDKTFYGLNSIIEFSDYLKVLSENKKITIKKDKDIVFVIIEIIYLYKPSNVKIPLILEKMNIQKTIQEICKEIFAFKEQLKKIEKEYNNANYDNKIKEETNEINALKEENKKLLEEIEKIKGELNDINNIKEDVKEIKVLKEEIKSISNEINNIKKEVKEIKVLKGEIKSISNEINNIKEEEKEIKVLKEEIKRINNKINNIKEENKKLVEQNKSYQEQLNIINNMNERNNKILDMQDKTIKGEINEIKKILKPINLKVHGFYNRTFLMDINDFELLKEEIIKKTNKKIKTLKKLYQATVDGGDTSVFHSNCDNIPNTLIIIRSAGYRRFGGFTTEMWDTSGKFKDDRKSFLFSLDNRKIYSYKCNGKAIYCHKDFGPTFGTGYTIKIDGNPLTGKFLYTYEFYPDGCSYNFNGDSSALSESGKGNQSYIYAGDYEVYQVIFFE